MSKDVSPYIQTNSLAEVLGNFLKFPFFLLGSAVTLLIWWGLQYWEKRNKAGK